MRSLYRTLSVRYVSRRWLRAGLIALSVGLGVATLVATQALNWTMARAAVFAANPTSGLADFIVANGELPVPRSLEKELLLVPGVAEAEPRINENAFAPQLDNRAVLVLGIDFAKAAAAAKTGDDPTIQVSQETQAKLAELLFAAKMAHLGEAAVASKLPGLDVVGKWLIGSRAPAPVVMTGRELFQSLPPGTKSLSLRRSKAVEPKEYALAGAYDASGMAAALAGYVAVLDLSDAAVLFGLSPDQVHRFDVKLSPGTDPAKARIEIEKVLHGRALVRTFAEQSQNTQNVMAGMQTGFSLCGLAALVVGLFLVYNALSVTVTERRHEIGILRSLGATRSQILGLFAGEALVLGFVGSLVGIPMGMGLAHLGLGPMQAVLGDIFFVVDARQVDVSWTLFGIAIVAGMLTTLLASLLPAFKASREKPADAVRKVLKATSVHSLLLHIATSLLFLGVGTAMIFGRDYLPPRWGTLGGMCVVLIGGLLASPFVSGLVARMIQPFVRRTMSIEWRLAADNIVRSPGRTGLVIGALGAGVSLVVQTGGVICSNRACIESWIEDAIAADLIVTSGSPVGAGGQMQPMPDSLVREIRGLEGVEAALPVRIRKIPYGGTQIMLLTAPNMAGKSVYLRQVALIVILAQIGSFVPAEAATLGIVDRIFTRVGLTDFTLQGHSSFMVEMIETANILHNATPKSLILLDEVGRGTATVDGLSIARSIVEYLHNHPKVAAKTMFATHYHELTDCANYLPRVKNFHLAVKEIGNPEAQVTLQHGRAVFIKFFSLTRYRDFCIFIRREFTLATEPIRRAMYFLCRL